MKDKDFCIYYVIPMKGGISYEITEKILPNARVING